jgi:hypothetical protein
MWASQRYIALFTGHVGRVKIIQMNACEWSYRSTIRISADLQPRARLGDPRIISNFQQISHPIDFGSDEYEWLEYFRDPSLSIMSGMFTWFVVALSSNVAIMNSREAEPCMSCVTEFYWTISHLLHGAARHMHFRLRVVTRTKALPQRLRELGCVFLSS